jgi:dynein heavy chain
VQLLEGLLPTQLARGAPPPDKKLIEHHFVFACIWAFGGCLAVLGTINYRLQFSKWWQMEHKNVVFPPEVSELAYTIDVM